MEETNDKPVFHNFTGEKSSLPLAFIFLGVFTIVAGLASGYLLVSLQNAKATTVSQTTLSKSSVQTGSVYGSDDTATFKDTAEGVDTAGGINGEGQYHLVRVGGDSQNVYMTSSIVDLSLFTGKRIKVWGQTQKAQTAGWLMDVGRVQVE